MTFKNVLFAPKLERLVSISQLTEHENVEVSFKNKKAVLQINGMRFIFGTKIGKLYKMNYCNFAVVKESDKNEVKISPSVSKSLSSEIRVKSKE